MADFLAPRRLCWSWQAYRSRSCPWHRGARARNAHLAAPAARGLPACATTNASKNSRARYFRAYSWLPIMAFRQAPRHALRIRAVAFALVKLLLDIMFGDEVSDHGFNRSRHGYGIHQIGTERDPGFAFGRIYGRAGQHVGRIARGRTQRDPKQRPLDHQIFSVVSGFRTIKLDIGGSGKERCALAVVRKLGPSRRAGNSGERAHGTPKIIGPRTGAFAAFNNNANGNRFGRRYNAQLTASRYFTGKPVTRFCGFIRIRCSRDMASTR